jgi:hypothetical protein
LIAFNCALHNIRMHRFIYCIIFSHLLQ